MVDVDFFLQEGYQVIRNLIPCELIEQTRKFLLDEKEKMVAELLKSFDLKDEGALLDFIDALVAEPSQLNLIEPDLQMKLTGHFSLQTRLSFELLQIPKLPEIRQIYEHIFPDQKMCLHMPPTARFILPRNSLAAVPPHQDVSYNEHVNDFFVLWIPFSEITDERGGIKVFKGTNRAEQFEVSKEEGHVWFSGVETSETSIEHCKMQLGDVLLLNKWIVHASMPNLSAETRISIDFRFFYGASQKHYFDFEKNCVIPPNHADLALR